jgi:hypothetical protein
MSKGTTAQRETVVELEFELGEESFFLASASERTACELEVETMTPRSDGSILEFITIRGGDPATVVEHLRESPGIVDVEVVTERDDEALIECVSESQIAESLADEGTVFRQIIARGGQGRLVTEVPPHVDASTVIDSFVSEFPDAELVARRSPVPVTVVR